MKHLLFLGSLLLASQISFAAPRKSNVNTKRKNRSKNQKEISFDEILVQGNHHFSDEAVITVEQDKVLDALLEVPKDFKKRISKSAKRN